MSHPGMGVMIRYLCGNDGTVKAVQGSLNKVIKSVEVEDNKLHLVFVDDTNLYLHDDGQSCCEHRYMVCDDDLTPYVGATLTNLEVAEAPDIEDEYGEMHEVQFLKVHTNKGYFTISNHNEHNGYYGGFALSARTDWPVED